MKASTALQAADGEGIGRTAGTITVYMVVFFGVLPAFLWFTGARLDHLFRWPPISAAWRYLGLMLFVVGWAGMLWSMTILIVRGRGLPISHLAPRRLVARGPYLHMRHPVYVFYTAAFAGTGLWIGSVGRGIVAAGLLSAGWLIYALGFEEPRLVRRLGDGYAAYRAAVPVIPLGSVTRAVRRMSAAAWMLARPVAERAANRVVLFRIGPTIWVTYGALLALGAALAAAVIGSLLVSGGMSVRFASGYLAGLAAASVIGGRLVWLAYQGRNLVLNPLTVVRSVGFVSWGAVIAAVALPLAVGRLAPGGSLWLLDRTLPGLLVAEVVGRLGCLTYGCCFGRLSDHGVRWTNPAAKLIRQDPGCSGQRRVPTQLIASGWALFALLLVLGATAAPIPSGTVAALTLILYALGRFAGDCLRDEPRFGSWELTAGQLGSVAAAALGFVLLMVADGPPAWTRPAWQVTPEALLSLWPAIAVSGAVVLLGCGLHWRRVGRW